MKFQVAVIMVALLVAQAALGQEPVSKPDSEVEGESTSLSGYDDLAEFGGPESISASIEITQRIDQVWTIGVGWANPSNRHSGPGSITSRCSRRLTNSSYRRTFH